MNMKKNWVFFVLFCWSSLLSLAAQNSYSFEMNNVVQCFSEQKYALAIELTYTFLDKNPPALYKDKTLQILAESYWHLKDYEKSLEFFDLLEENPANDYFRAMALYHLNNTSAFYSAATRALSSLSEQNNWAFYLEVSRALITSFIQDKRYEDAMIFCQEYFEKYKNLDGKEQQNNLETLKNTIPVYCEILYKTENYANLVLFYEKNEACFSPEYFARDDYACELFLIASSYKNLHQYNNALTLYKKVIEIQSENFSLPALEEAYDIADSKENLLQTAEKSLQNNQKVLAKFFLQTALDAFEQQNWTVAKRFFDKTLEKNEPEFSEIAFLYNEQISLLQNNFSNKKECIISLEKALPFVEFYSDDYWYILAQLYLLENNDEKFAQSLENITKEVYLPLVYYGKGLLAYKSEKFAEAAAFLQTHYCRDFFEAELLLAQSLSRLGKYEEADLLFEKNSTIYTSRLSFIKHLLLQKKYEDASAFFMHNQLKGSEGYYLKALTALALGDWGESRKNFEDYFSSNTLKTPIAYSKFYYAYSLYRLTDYEKAFACFEEFIEESTNISFLWKAYDYMTKSALQLYAATKNDVWQQKGLLWGQITFEKSLTEEQKRNSLSQFVGMCIDVEDYEKALSFLEKPSQENSSLGLIALLQKAELYLKQNKLDSSDECLSLIVKRFSGEQLAEDAAYKRGEIFYHAKQWEKSLESFSEYRSDYPHGKYYDSALYFSAQCLVELQQKIRGIMMYKDLVEHAVDSPHIFSALCKLVALYQENEEYGQAIKTAEKLLVQFGDQAKRVGIEYQMEEIALLQQGESKEIAQNFRLYRQHGELGSVAGRSYGLLLAKSQMESVSGKKEAETLLVKIIAALQNAYKGEEVVIAEASFLYGKILRDDLRYTEASDVFLKSAQLYSKIDTEKAAESMYRAVESLHTMGNPYDAQAVLTVMKATYKTADWTKQAQLLLQR